MPVDSPHPSVAAMQTDLSAGPAPWRAIRDVCAGPRAVKSAPRCYVYLPRLPGHRIVPVVGSAIGIAGLPPGTAISGNVLDEYQIYLDRAVLLSGFVERVIGGLTGMATRKPPVIEVPTDIEEQLDNVTLDGTTLAGLSKNVLTETLTMSWGGVLVDWSERHGRPYQRQYIAEDVLNWRIDFLDGQPVPTRVVLAERMPEPDPEDPWQEKCVQQCRVLELVADAELTAAAPDEFPFGRLMHRIFQLMEVSGGKEEWVEVQQTMPTRYERPLGFIPFQPVNSTDVCWCVRRPAMLNIVNMVLAHYKNSADYENAIHAAGVPTLAVWGIDVKATAPGSSGKIEIGPGRVITGENPAGHAEYVQTAGQGAAEIKAAMEAKEAAMATMAARLLLSQERRVAVSAESQMVGFVADDASLTTVVDAVEQAMTNALVWHCWWAGPAGTTLADFEEEVEVKLNRDFIEQPMPPQSLNQLGLEVDAQRLPLEDYFVNAQRGGLIRPGLSFEEYLAERQATGATTDTGESAASFAALKAAMASGDPTAIRDAMASMEAMMGTGMSEADNG